VGEYFRKIKDSEQISKGHSANITQPFFRKRTADDITTFMCKTAQKFWKPQSPVVLRACPGL